MNLSILQRFIVKRPPARHDSCYFVFAQLTAALSISDMACGASTTSTPCAPRLTRRIPHRFMCPVARFIQSIGAFFACVQFHGQERISVIVANR